jgi:hypothetical protein
MTYTVPLYKHERGYCNCEDKLIFINYSPERGKKFLELTTQPVIFKQVFKKIVLLLRRK